MTDRSFLQKGADYLTEYGTIRTIGAVAAFCGNEINKGCRRLHQIYEWDRGKGYTLGLRARAVRRGFSAHSYLWLGLDTANSDLYLNSTEPFSKLNAGYIVPIHNKYTFQLLTEPYIDALPALYGRLDSGEFRTGPSAQQYEGVFDVLERVQHLVLKPVTGGKGSGIYVVCRDGGGIVVNGRQTRDSDFAERIAELDEYLVTEFINQHTYAESIFPDATNTLRIFSIIDPDTGEARILRAVHRFGSKESAPTDNWSQNGYCAPIDVESGSIKRLIVLEGLSRSKLEQHPETDARIKGIKIPYWTEVCDLVRAAADLHRQAPIVGWDIAVSDSGPILIEGNARPGKELLQLERGILEDSRVRRLLDGDEVME